MNRGRNRDIIFRDDDDAVLFLDSLKDTVESSGIEVHAYSLMPNHYHLLVRSPLGTLSKGMQSFGREYTQCFNERHGGDGSLFRGRFKSELVTNTRYLLYLLGYIHLNPLKASLITRLDSYLGWTSHREYMGLERRPDWLTVDTILEQLGSPSGLEEFILNLHRGVENWPEEMDLLTGWFNKGKRSSSKLEEGQATADEDETVELPQLMQEICAITGVSRSRLQQSIRGPGGNPERRFAIWALSQSTYMTHSAIGKELGVATGHVSKDLSRSYAKIPTFSGWAEKWRERYYRKLSIV